MDTSRNGKASVTRTDSTRPDITMKMSSVGMPMDASTTSFETRSGS